MTLPQRLIWLFVGPQGLRLPWSLLLLVLLAGAVQIGLVLGLSAAGFTQADFAGDSDSATGTIATSTLALVTVIVITIAMALIERRRLGEYGLALRKLALRLLQGLLAGIVLISGLVGTQVLFGALSIDRVNLHGGAAWVSGAQWALACLMIGVFEELLCRGYLLARLKRSFGFRTAAIVTTALFAAAHFHNLGEGALGLITVVAVGLMLCFALWKTGSLWWGIGFHAAWDWGESYVFGTADSGFQSKGALLVTHPNGLAWLSGGDTGPEGSALCLVAVLLGVAWVQWLLPKRAAER